MGVLQERIKRHLQLSHLQVALSDADPGRDVQSIAICAGSGGSVLLGADADVYWTGEMSHHEVLAAVAAGKNVVLCGHTNTERPYLDTLAQLLESNLKGLEGQDKAVAEQLRIHVSKEDRHPLDIV
ncbi:hypothetical protein EWM64_g1763 [Hericium alpestre]|uniref:NIF3-like protein 1 n=1 Tax=Hericium alpestre TaxID=135208 RepID=A0A4Z0A704_9AGAM|nr:hypothetical protein EWM64_g1763 [Hericium alpestre]